MQCLVQAVCLRWCTQRFCEACDHLYQATLPKSLVVQSGLIQLVDGYVDVEQADAAFAAMLAITQRQSIFI